MNSARAIRKLKNSKGYSLTEMLCVIVVLILISGLLTLGTRFSADTFNQSVMFSEAQMLCNTLKIAVNDELRFSGRVDRVDEDYNYFSQNYGFGKLTQNDEGQIVVKDEEGQEYKLLSSMSYTYGMQANIDVDYETKEDGRGLFSVKLTITDKSGDEQLSYTEFDVRQLNCQPEAGYGSATAAP